MTDAEFLTLALREATDDIDVGPGFAPGVLRGARQRVRRNRVVAISSTAVAVVAAAVGLVALPRPGPAQRPPTHEAASDGWTKLDTSSLGLREAHAVTALGDSDLWVSGFGSADMGTSPTTTLSLPGDHKVTEGAGTPAVGIVAHWDGRKWHTDSLPKPGQAYGLAAVTADDVWAVGSGLSQPLMAHWDGQAWRDVPTPNPVPAGAHISYTKVDNIAAVSAKDVWASGCAVHADYPNPNEPDIGFLQHWDGQQWTLATLPSIPDAYLGCVKGLGARSSNDVWAVADYVETVGKKRHLSIGLHWNGDQWSATPFDQPKDSSRLLVMTATGVALTGTNDTWALGYISTTDGKTALLTQRWDGTAWRDVPETVEPGLAGSIVVTSIVPDGHGGVSAVFGGQGGSPLTMHWDGSGWKRAEWPNPGKDIFLTYLTAAPGSGTTWAVGTNPVSHDFWVGRLN